MSSDEHQILKFQPRTLARGSRAGTANVDPGFSKSLDQSGSDDYRHRMTTNLAAFAFTALLTGIGIWLAVKLADLRAAQDCVLMGRHDCAHISSPRG